MIIFLYGEDTYRSRLKLKEMKAKFLKEVDPSGNSIVTISGENVDIGEINELIGASSLFARRRMVIIEKLLTSKNKSITDQVYQNLAGYFAKKDKSGQGHDNENILIFWEEGIDNKSARSDLFNFLGKQKFVYSFKPLSSTDVTLWIKQEFSQRGALVGERAAFLLAGLFGNNLWQLSNEIDKLISYKSDNAGSQNRQEIIVDENEINFLARGNFDENIFALTDAISNKNKALAMSLLEKEIEAGISEINILFMIERQFRILFLVRQCLDKAYTSRKIVASLKLHPFVVQKSLTQVRYFTLAGLKKILNNLIEIDKDIKTGRLEAKLGLSVLMAKI